MICRIWLGWTTVENADRYEHDGVFDHLLDSQKALLSELYQLKRDREKGGAGEMVTSDGVSVDYYTVLVEESFQERAAGATGEGG